MSTKLDAYGIPYDDPSQNKRRALAHAMMGQPNNGVAGTMPTIPAAPTQPDIGLGAPTTPIGGSYARPMDPHQAALARGQQAIDAERQQLAASQPQNVGQGIAAMGQAFNLAMKQRAQAQAAADPWAGMRETTQPAGGGFDIGGAFKKLFG